MRFKKLLNEKINYHYGTFTSDGDFIDSDGKPLPLNSVSMEDLEFPDLSKSYSLEDASKMSIPRIPRSWLERDPDEEHERSGSWEHITYHDVDTGLDYAKYITPSGEEEWYLLEEV